MRNGRAPAGFRPNGWPFGLQSRSRLGTFEPAKSMEVSALGSWGCAVSHGLPSADTSMLSAGSKVPKRDRLCRPNGHPIGPESCWGSAVSHAFPPRRYLPVIKNLLTHGFEARGVMTKAKAFASAIHLSLPYPDGCRARFPIRLPVFDP